ncbi:MAG: c-type cytochrome [Rhodospirillaceae bacterium]
MTARRAVSIAILVLLLLLAIGYALTWRSSIDAIEPPPRSIFDVKLIEKGAQLAAIGDCNACHTAPGGKTYAGGRALETPFGTIYGTNITPDPYTGIGKWSEAAFVRAMREGVDREGRHLYPAFPYNYFTRLSDDDLAALYAYLMTREPVRTETPANKLGFPFNIRPLLAGWKLLYLDRTSFASDTQQSAEWNRGAYLAQGLAHCGACHTPRNRMGAEKEDELYAGGEIEGWHAPALNGSAPAPAPWTAERLYTYLRTGSEEAHGSATGPMAPVVHNLSNVPESEVRAIAAYIASYTTQAPADRQKRGEELATRAGSGTPLPTAQGSNDTGAQIYRGACSVCHDAPRDPTTSGAALNLALSTAVAAPTPRNLINFILYGIAPEEGARGRWMPGFAGALTDDQIVALANYLRQTAVAGAQPWQDVGEEVKKAKRGSAEPLARR